MTGTLRAERSQSHDPGQAPDEGWPAIQVFSEAPLAAPRAAPPVSPEDRLHVGVPPVSRRLETGVGGSFGTHLVILLLLLLISPPPRHGDVAPEPSTVRFVFAEPPMAPSRALEPKALISTPPPQPEPPVSPAPQVLPRRPVAAPSAPAAAQPLPNVWTPSVQPTRMAPPLPKVWAPSVQPTPNAPPPAPAAPSQATGAPAFDQNAHIDTDWAASVGDWLVQHRTSQTDARLRHVHGVVVIRFNVQPDGQVVGVSVLHSSGIRGLDQAAMAMVRGARLPPFPPSMVQRLQSVIVPIRYELE
jgi:protein TonB